MLVPIALAACCTADVGPSPDGLTPQAQARWSLIDAQIRTRFAEVPLISIEEYVALSGGEDAPVLVDVRAAPEFAVSHIPGAISAPQARGAVAELLGDVARDRPIVVYCSVGWRSGEAGRALLQSGFTDVHNLEGSIFAWANQGRPLIDGEGAATDFVHPYDESWGELLHPARRAPLR